MPIEHKRFRWQSRQRVSPSAPFYVGGDGPAVRRAAHISDGEFRWSIARPSEQGMAHCWGGSPFSNRAAIGSDQRSSPLLTLGVAGFGPSDRRHGQTIGRDGGSLEVTFAKGQPDEKTETTFLEAAGGRPSIPAFVPLDKPFDVHLANEPPGGSVTVKYQLPTDLAGYDEAVFMVIEKNCGWRLLPVRSARGKVPSPGTGNISYLGGFRSLTAETQARGLCSFPHLGRLFRGK